jgi:hypothetical protein
MLQSMVFRSNVSKTLLTIFRFIQTKRTFFIVVSTVVLLVVVAAGLVGILSQHLAHAKDPVYPDPSNQANLPDSVKVTSQDETVLLRASVEEGSQIYECQASTTDPSGYAWKLQAPFALLKADNKTNVIHSTDPTWLYTEDGSEVEAQVGQYTKPDGTVVAASATPDANSIPWLRLTVTVHRGTVGLFSRVDQIQRLYTAGGKAPKDGCNRDAANDHLIQSIAYTAEYVFWGH